MTADGQRTEPDGEAARSISARFARLAAAVRTSQGRLTERYPKAAETVRVALATDSIDRCFIVAAQLFITAVPMAIAVTAFLPRSLRDGVRRSVSDQLGIHGQAEQAVSAFFDGQNTLRETVGVIGLVLALMSATSLSRRLQRIYERQWSLSPGRMKSSVIRWLAWIVVWVVALAVQSPVRSGSGGRLVLGWIASAAMSVAMWWWTPHLLLLHRVGWRQLLPTALLTGLGQAAVGVGSRLVMPTVTSRSVSEYGPFGLVLSLMSWLLVVAGVIVIGAEIGRIIGEETADAPGRSHVLKPEEDRPHLSVYPNPPPKEGNGAADA